MVHIRYIDNSNDFEFCRYASACRHRKEFQMQFGHFDDQQREYVITDPRTPLPWINYLGSEDFFTLLSNTAGGYCFYRDARLRRLTRYRYNNCPVDQEGFHIYIKDGKTVWNPGWQPTKTELDRYTCRHGLGYSVIEGQKNGVSAAQTLLVPQGENCLLIRLCLKNETDIKKTLDVFPYVEFCLWDAMDDSSNFQRNFSIGEVELEPEAIYHKSEYRERRNHYAVLWANRPYDGFDTARDAFIGPYGSPALPEAVAAGCCTGSIVHGWAPVGAMQFHLELCPGESQELFFGLGYVENPEGEKFSAPGVINKTRAHTMIETYRTAAQFDAAADALRGYWDTLLSNYHAETGENTAAEETPAAEPASEEGKVFNIYAWNEEFKGFFEKYYTVPEGVTVNWIITPSADGAYQDKLDEALLNQENASADDKVDLFLAEADYIQKYTESPVTQDVTALGVTDFSNTYAYTVQAASDASGVVKGVSFQCCPAALIYRRSIAKDVLGTDDPAEVQELLNSWDKFNAVAADAKAKGYLMTASEAATYRVFSNNVSEPWVDANNNLQIDPAIQTWMQQAKDFSDNGYTQDCDIWSDECTAQMFGEGKAMCYFGPAWYFNFSMGNAQDADKGCFGDWAICEGPQAHFWGGTWLLAPAGTDNPTMVADIMNTFINNEEVCTNLVKNEAQFSNNQKVNETVAQDPAYGSDFLGGQNDIALFCDLAKNIKFENHTIYDQLLNEGLQANWREYCKGTVTEDEAMSNFYKYINEKYPTIVTP
jgi:hypothetical protein